MTKDFTKKLYYWTHMLDESFNKQSYYKVYMQGHPDVQLKNLQQKLANEFYSDLEKHNVDIYEIYLDFMNEFKDQTEPMFVTSDQLDFINSALDQKIKFRYNWNRIKSQIYAAIITRNSAKLDNAKGKYIQEDDTVQWSDIRRNVSLKTLEECLDTICYNLNVLEANTYLCGRPSSKEQNQISIDNILKAYENAGFKHMPLGENDPNPYFFLQHFYNRWASYEKNGKFKSQFGSGYICNSDHGPEELRKILNQCPYDADEDELVMTLNKCLDIVHFRGDLAAAFIEGGQQTCSMVSNMPPEIVF